MSISRDTKFWVVTVPTKKSTLKDICFECDLHGLRLQFLGGLDDKDIHEIYEDEKTAKRVATVWLQILH